MEETTTKPVNPVESAEIKPAETTPEDKAPETPVKESEGDAPADPLLDGYYMTNPFFHELANFFGIEQRDFESTKDKLSVIADWAYKESQSKEPGEILLTLRRLENKIQPADWGEKRYSNVYKYIRLAMQKQSLEKSMAAFEKGTK